MLLIAKIQYARIDSLLNNSNFLKLLQNDKFNNI